MGNFFSDIIIKIGVSILKALIIAGLTAGCAFLMLVLSIDIINFLETGKWVIFQFFNHKGVPQEAQMENIIAFFSTLKRIIPGDELLGNVLGLNDFFGTLNIDFFLFVNDVITTIKEDATWNEKFSMMDQPLLREFAVMTISSFIMVEILRVTKLFFKFGGIGMTLGLIYGAIYWIAASYAVSECILLFIDKMVIGNIGAIQQTSIYIIIILMFLGLEILIGTFASKENLLKSCLLTALNLMINCIKTALAWYFTKAVTVAIQTLASDMYINQIELYSKIALSLLLCFVIFILFTVLQEKLQKDPSKKDFDNLGIIKWFSKVFKH